MKKLILFILLGISNSLLAQGVCGGSYENIDNGFMPKAQSCAQNTSTYLDKYRYQATYKPKSHAFIDEVIIPINIIVLCDDNGDYGAYTPTTYNAETQKEFWLNRAYQRTSLPSDPVSCQYQIFNLNGQMLLKGEITENKGEVVIDTRALRSGIYVALISNNGIIKASKKIEVRKNN